MKGIFEASCSKTFEFPIHLSFLFFLTCMFGVILIGDSVDVIGSGRIPREIRASSAL